MSLTDRLTFIAAACGLAVLSGCASAPPKIEGARAFAQTPLDQYRITVKETPDEVALAVHADGVSAAQRDALATFAARWRAAGGGTLTIRTPSDAPDPAAARMYADGAISTLQVLGVPYEAIRSASYAQGPAEKVLVLASFESATAVAPDCKRVPWENLTATNSNAAMKRLGCTTTANLAAMLADPRDLKTDGSMGPADTSRRMNVLDKYRDGKITSSDKDEHASGAVSNAVKP